MVSGAPTGQGGPHVFVADLEVPVFEPQDHRHLSGSLRLRTGDPLTIGNGRGAWRPARFADVPEPAGEIVVVERAQPLLGVGFVVPKGDRPSWIVQKLTELGIDIIQPLHSSRSVVLWDAARSKKHLGKLRRVAREAAMQSRQVYLPEVRQAVLVSTVLEGSVAVAERGGDPPTLANPSVLVGPEGGWDDGEIPPSIPRVGLGSAVLRAETAAVAVGVALSFLRSDLVVEHSE
jgi:16S rRNA (uracil1498-N3)-methyltransferase